MKCWEHPVLLHGHKQKRARYGNLINTNYLEKYVKSTTHAVLWAGSAKTTQR